MESSKKNTPGPVVIASISVIVLLIIFYFILMLYFPELLAQMSLGEKVPVK
ncbi:hypothetical protein [Kaistella jeonii]|uniref:hypothetical protein n=1 Tax=Kaistella jeonii TaxID=266749 RepID=UPI0008E04CF2|nr:hypothetical protein [Kaistella jeonii]SFC17603.1 hypothetical protein SAMN05421876_10864 [Kaistella jeonii]VEI95428.1 Uncharacterised protein [Kaistella jeonii]